MTPPGQNRAELFGRWVKRYDRPIASDSFPLAGHLAAEGPILIGDVAFPNMKARDECHRTWRAAWDEDEHDWASESMKSTLAKRGPAVEYERVSFCGGVLSLHRAAAS